MDPRPNPARGKEQLLEQLTGVDSSKLNYYVELKKRNQEVLKQNSRLEILQQLSRDLNIDMSFEEILARARQRLPEVLPCDFLGLASRRQELLVLSATAPAGLFRGGPLEDSSRLWSVLTSGETTVYDPRLEPALVPIRPGAPGLRSLVAAPLFERGAITGLLLLGSVQEQAFDRAELSFVEHLADQLAISLHNARLYEQVSKARRQWEATFQAVTDPIFLIDTDYRVLQHNDRLPAELRPAWDQALAARCFARLGDAHADPERCPLRQLQRQGEPVCQRWQTESGRLLDLYYYPVVNAERQLTAATLIIKDVTEKTKLEAQLVQSAKLAALGEMAAGVAHELNSPMTVVIGTAQLLARELPPAEAEALEDIISCGQRCKEIIQNLLNFSRQDQPPVTGVDLNREVARVLSLIQYQINRNQIRIEERLDPALPSITATGSQIQQVLTNLLLNARDALSGVERTDKRIEVRTRLEAGEAPAILLQVADNGCGIDAADLARIFTPFYTSKAPSEGTGLGLSVSRGIAEALGGSLGAESEPGRGSCFTLRLPLSRADQTVSADGDAS